MTTALFVQRDATYVPIVRKLRGTMTREEWDHPGYRMAAIAKAGRHGVAHIKQSDATAEFVCPLPVSVYLDRTTGAVVCADIRRTLNQPVWISATGTVLLLPPSLGNTMVKRTTYANWAEGPLPHITPDLVDAVTPDYDPEIKRLRAQNSALREALDAQLSAANWSAMPRSYDPSEMSNLVDFRIRYVFKVRDFQPLDSLQATSAKLKTSDGVIELGQG